MNLANRVLSMILWLFGPLDAYLSRLARARMEIIFGLRGPITWAELSPFFREEPISWGTPGQEGQDG